MSRGPEDIPEELRRKRAEVDRFLLEEIDTVPHLEALLLLYRARPETRTVEEVGRALYVDDEDSRSILEDLKRRDLIGQGPQGYVYNSASERNSLIAEVDEIYRRELVRISGLIHSKASSSVREFARAFRFRLKKD